MACRTEPAAVRFGVPDQALRRPSRNPSRKPRLPRLREDRIRAENTMPTFPAIRGKSATYSEALRVIVCE